MSYTAIPLYVAGTVLTAANLNTNLRDIVNGMQAGTVELEQVLLDGQSSAPSLSPADQAVVYYDNVLKLLQLSVDEGAFVGLALDDEGLIKRPELRGYEETVVAVSISAGTLTIDLDAGTVFVCTLNANITTFTISNGAAGKSFVLYLIQDGTVRTVTWGSGKEWQGGVAPTMTGTNGRKDVVSGVTRDGTNWELALYGLNFAGS